MLDIPVDIAGTGSGEVRRGLVDDRDFQAFGIGLLLSSDVDVNTVPLAILVRVDFSFNPKALPNPVVGI
jgi:hypothetical protein